MWCAYCLSVMLLQKVDCHCGPSSATLVMDQTTKLLIASVLLRAAEQLRSMNQLEAELEPDELRQFEDMVLNRYDISDFDEVKPEEVRLAIRFREVMREREGPFGWKAVKAVPSEHVHGDGKRLMLIFEDVSHAADEVQFSDDWHEVEKSVGAWLESYNNWSASVYSSKDL